MSVSIRWAASPEGNSLDGTSTDLDNLRAAFGMTGDGKVALSAGDSKTLRAMALVSGFPNRRELYSQLADLAEQQGNIEVWGVW